ncbi:MAG: prepilin-type N-terminal cleavage/methylation domain-containing protein [Planctomycetaceae bacterium]|jgi:type II secretory pathway pseudopilin PulG|nr:prepilin-type N-terminal cleavage/methylation domain-containing protein [Planctomycetaceae bacterium]
MKTKQRTVKKFSRKSVAQPIVFAKRLPNGRLRSGGSRKIKHGFTLIELLVIIAGIHIFISLFLPW